MKMNVEYYGQSCQRKANLCVEEAISLEAGWSLIVNPTLAFNLVRERIPLNRLCETDTLHVRYPGPKTGPSHHP